MMLNKLRFRMNKKQKNQMLFFKAKGFLKKQKKLIVIMIVIMIMIMIYISLRLGAAAKALLLNYKEIKDSFFISKS